MSNLTAQSTNRLVCLANRSLTGQHRRYAVGALEDGRPGTTSELPRVQSITRRSAGGRR